MRDPISPWSLLRQDDSFSWSPARPKLPLFWQIFLPNAAFLVIAVSVLAFTPAAVNDTPTASQAVGLAVGLLVLVLINVLSIRHAVKPVEHLTRVMRRSILSGPESASRALAAAPKRRS